MARYAIGDIQGCYEELRALQRLIQFNPDLDKVYLVGDLVNRGPMSLEVLRYVKQCSPAIEMVLGNHDLHLLGCWAGVTKAKGLDTLESVLAAMDVDELMHWLRRQPLLLSLPDYVVVHAGVNPSVDFEVLSEIAHFCNEKLAGDDYLYWLGNMYGNAPTAWQANLSEQELFRFGINSLTRMRMLDSAGLDFKFKGALADAPKNLKPWFAFGATNEKQIVFGHWSALGLIVNGNIVSLDTGCIWGGQLTAICLDDGTLFQVPAVTASALFMD
jgi:bis(5'-nucleosyl)-tetraphosphatase (symmetrical)